MINKLIKIPILKRLIPSITIRFFKFFKKNRGYFNVNGINMYLDFLDPIDRAIILNKSYEEEEFQILKELTKKHMIPTFIDIGANCGYFSFKFAMENLKIFAFEPNSEALIKMQNTLKKNKLFEDKIKIFPFGISNNNSKLQMKSMIKHGYAQTGGSSVTDRTETLSNKFKFFDAEFKIGDEILNFKKEYLLIKIDVEGHELNVLEGLSNLLTKNKCILMIEIFEKNFENTNKFLFDKGFILIDKIQIRSNYFYSNIK